jgi:hypothetical protein
MKHCIIIVSSIDSTSHLPGYSVAYSKFSITKCNEEFTKQDSSKNFIIMIDGCIKSRMDGITKIDKLKF